MKISLLVIGKTRENYLKEGMVEYLKRLGRYITFDYRELPDIRGGGLDEEAQKDKEGDLFLRSVKANEFLVLLDERGKELSSPELAAWMERKMLESSPDLCFLIGGPYGFSPAIREKASATLSLSKMTFSHQMVRLIFLEQLYRAFTIIRGEPYHHA
jgi:23S rRNA (pseudouridine1915-N3)-methyltransferase